MKQPYPTKDNYPRTDTGVAKLERHISFANEVSSVLVNEYNAIERNLFFNALRDNLLYTLDVEIKSIKDDKQNIEAKILQLENLHLELNN